MCSGRNIRNSIRVPQRQNPTVVNIMTTPTLMVTSLGSCRQHSLNKYFNLNSKVSMSIFKKILLYGCIISIRFVVLGVSIALHFLKLHKIFSKWDFCSYFIIDLISF